MPGQGGLDRNIKGFRIPDLADKDNVRVLTQNGTQCRRERQTEFRAYVDLVKPLDLEFHRIFHGHNIASRGIDIFEDRIQGRGLSASGRAASQDHAVRSMAALFQSYQGVGFKT